MTFLCHLVDFLSRAVLRLRTFARNFSSRDNFFKFLLQADNELLVPEMQPSSFQRLSVW